MPNNFEEAIVYLVDDEFSVRDSMQMFIESTGLKVKCYESAADFLNQYEAESIGCLILDVRMPEMDGLELQDELNKREIILPIIFISGNAEIPDSAKAFRAGALDFLEKPFDNKLLLARIYEALEKHRDIKQHLEEKQRIRTRLDCLTPRELEVLRLILNSHSNKETARILDISHRTVEIHRTKVMEKLQVHDITALVNLLAKYEILQHVA